MKKLTKAEWLKVLHILKSVKNSIGTKFVWINPLTYIYLIGSMIHLGILYLINGKKFEL